MNIKNFIISAFLIFTTFGLGAQVPGDTIRVQGFTFSSTTRDTVLKFPDLPSVSYEKILLKYTMRCKDALVSTGAERNKGCGEWDYSCNTYVVDSSKIESVPTTITSHIITNYSKDTFAYSSNPIYNYRRGKEKEVSVTSTSNEVSGTVGAGTMALKDVLSTDSKIGKSRFIYTATELTAAGLSAGEIDALSLSVQGTAGQANFLKIRLKQSSQTNFTGGIDLDGFKEVYYRTTTLKANQTNRFQFYTPFIWDGTSNIIVEFGFTNIAGTSTETSVEGSATAAEASAFSNSQNHLYLTNNSYVEADNYLGITGSQNRTMEAWVKTSASKDAEICSWGTNSSGKKWVFRLTAVGNLRLEINGGGVVSAPTVNDGNWHHVACVLDGNNLTDIKFYIDGKLVTNSTIDNLAINTEESYKVRISRGVNDRYLDAEIDEIKIWDTNLSEQTISQWMRLKPNASHPNYSNLQLYYDFNETNGTLILDQSGKNRDANIIGEETRVNSSNELDYYTRFSLSQNRPNITFFQGDYTLDIQNMVTDRPFAQSPLHFVTSQNVISGDPNVAKHDAITKTTERYWVPKELIYDDSSNALIAENNLTEDGTIFITDKNYFRRYPWYNELVSFVTPYGIGVDFGKEGKTWMLDMTDYTPLLKGNKRLLMTLGGEWQEEMDLEFLFIVGTPPQDIVQYEQIWQGTNRIGSARIADIINDVKFKPKKIGFSKDGSTFKLKSSITGHGAAGEFEANGGQVYHRMNLDGNKYFDWTISQECSFNPIYPQGGTWVYDRQGWCPGERSLLKEHDITPIVKAGDSAALDYYTSNAPNSSGDYRYHVAHQIVGYGKVNHSLDARPLEIIAPNNSALYTRVGTICAFPKVKIQNTGSTKLESVVIKYWVNDAATPQSYTWNGSLEFLETAEVLLPSPRELWMDLKPDNNKFHVSTSEPNGGTDEYAQNNTISSHMDIPEVWPSKFTISVRTNNRASENSYQILGHPLQVIASNALTANNTTYNDDYELNGCFTLKVTDAGQDGLQWWANPNQGTGWIRVRNESGFIIKTFNADFGGGFEHSFTTNFPLSQDEINYLTHLEVFPNPANEQLTISGIQTGNTAFYITDILGKRVNTKVLSKEDKRLVLDISDLANGVYFVTLINGEITTTRKVVKE